MTFFQAAILGIIQGITEFLPISSSGHLVIGEHFFQIQKSSLIFEIVVHLATLIAVFVFFRKQIIKLTRRDLLLLAVGTVPAVIFSLLFEDWIEQAFQSIREVGLEFLINAIILLVGHWALTRQAKAPPTEPKEITIRQSAIIGTWQAVSILPAISRSGSTVTGALLEKIDREKAFTFSFLLSIPAILGASVLKLSDVEALSALSVMDWVTYFVGGVFAFVFGMLSLLWFRKIIQKTQLYIFAVYSLIVGLGISVYVYFS